jgi:hypothetical protein
MNVHILARYGQQCAFVVKKKLRFTVWMEKGSSAVDWHFIRLLMNQQDGEGFVNYVLLRIIEKNGFFLTR